MHINIKVSYSAEGQRTVQGRIDPKTIMVPSQKDRPVTVHVEKPPTSTEQIAHDEWERFMITLEGLHKECGEESNMTDRAMVLISCCIDHGVKTKGHIISVLKKFGFKPGHIAILLRDHAGTYPVRHWWIRNKDGEYRNIS